MKAFRARPIILIMIIAVTPAYCQWSEPLPVDSINGVVDDYYPSISPDGLSLYFADGNRLKVSHWTGSTWGSEQDLGPNVNAGQRQVKASVTADNRTLYFTSYRSGGYGSYDIWRSEWDDSCECWGSAEVMAPPINTEDMEWDVQLSHDGHKMYISSDRNFSWGDLDIWCSEWDDNNGTWGEPLNLGLGLNSSSRDYSPYPSADGNILYFASWNPHGFEPPEWLGPVDLFMAYKTGNEWDSVDIMPPPITTGYWETGPAITNDGLTLYFASTRPGGPGWTDIYVSQYTTPVIQDAGMNSTRNFLLNIYPNPFNGTASITYKGIENGEIEIINVAGQRVKTIGTSGRDGQVIWDATDNFERKVSSGIYFARARGTDHNTAIKLIYLK